MVPQTFHCGLKSYDFIFSFFDLIYAVQKKITRHFWRHKLVFRDSAQLEIFFFKCLFSFSFRRSICLICNLNSEGNLTRKHLNLELFPKGGSRFCSTNLSKFKLRYLSSYMRYCQNKLPWRVRLTSTLYFSLTLFFANFIFSHPDSKMHATHKRSHSRQSWKKEKHHRNTAPKTMWDSKI